MKSDCSNRDELRTRPRSTAEPSRWRRSHRKVVRGRPLDSLAGAAGRFARRHLATLGKPDHRPAPHARRARHLQQRRRAVRRRLRRRVSCREARPLPAPARRLERRRPRLAHRTRADRVRHRRSARCQPTTPTIRASARSTARTTSPGAAGTTGRRSASPRRTTFSTSSGMENAFLPFNRNGVLFPRKIGGKYFMLSRPERQRPHAVRRHLPQPEPRHVPLGHAPARDAPRRRRGRPVVAAHQDRRRPDPDRNRRRLADDLSRRDGHVQRLRLQHGRRAVGSATSRGACCTARISTS